MPMFEFNRWRDENLPQMDIPVDIFSTAAKISKIWLYYYLLKTIGTFAWRLILNEWIPVRKLSESQRWK